MISAGVHPVCNRRQSLLEAMILVALLRGKNEGLNRGNGDPPNRV